MKFDIFNINNNTQFKEIALEVFRYQFDHCSPYNEYCKLIGIKPQSVTSIENIPFIPISLFKNKEIICNETNRPLTYEKIFTSSSTTGNIPSKHYIKELSIYDNSIYKCFELFFDKPENYSFLALLPSYLERDGSSLVYMVQKLMDRSNSSYSGFYLYNHAELYNNLLQIKNSGKACILIGVSFALLDFISQHKISMPNLIVIETGGMKGRGKEISRDDLHKRIKEGFGIEQVYSEYSMAELLSQAWSFKEGIFETPPWMKIIIRDLNDPFSIVDNNVIGGINIIDLANYNSCSFIQTEDMGIKTADNLFKVLGRIKNSEIRGCNLLLES